MFLKFGQNNSGRDYCVGDIVSVNCGDTLKIESIINNAHINVSFLHSNTPKDYLKKATANNIRKGSVSNPYFPTAYGIGYIGEGRWSGGNNKLEYGAWRHMLARCYSSECSWYDVCTVSSEWHNFQNFAEWYAEEYVKGWELDKDILSGKVYSRDTCFIVPREVNTALIGVRDKNSGVHYDRSRRKFQSYADVGGERIRLGRFTTFDEAKTARNIVKSDYLITLANRYSAFKFSQPLITLADSLRNGSIEYVRC